jgi:hypothetical protein
MTSNDGIAHMVCARAIVRDDKGCQGLRPRGIVATAERAE